MTSLAIVVCAAVTLTPASVVTTNLTDTKMKEIEHAAKTVKESKIAKLVREGAILIAK